MGGIYDHAGLGIHRYSTDTGWKIPHFEKMLYDQASLILGLYLPASRIQGPESGPYPDGTDGFHHVERTS